MKILITGGHLSPALSVIEKLKGEDILYVGRKHALEGDKAFSLEYQTIKNLGIPFFPITTGKLQRKFTRYTTSSFLKFPLGFFQSFFVLKRFKPDVVLGFGSYVSLPIIIISSILKIPVVIHEQTLEAGFANKLSARFAAKICISFESSKRFFPLKKVVLTGNPLRKEIIEVSKMENARPERSPAPSGAGRSRGGKCPPRFAWRGRGKMKNKGLPLLYITGGSLGSHFINNLVKDTVNKLLKDFQVLHQTGDAKEYQDFDTLLRIKNELPENGENYTVKNFLTPAESAEALKKADLVVARAGINTVSELLFLGKPSLLIPLPFTQNNEQLKNAQFLKTLGLGEVLEQKKITTEVFLHTLERMYKNINIYKENSSKSKGLIDKDASSKIAEVVKNVYKKKKNKN